MIVVRKQTPSGYVLTELTKDTSKLLREPLHPGWRPADDVSMFVARARDYVVPILFRVKVR